VLILVRLRLVYLVVLSQCKCASMRCLTWNQARSIKLAAQRAGCCA